MLAVLDSGTFYHHETIRGARYRDRFDRVLYAPDVTADQIADAAAVIVPDRTHPAILRRKRRLLIDYVHRGGTLIVFAETHSWEWAPEVSWRFQPTDFWWWLTPGADPGLRVAAPEHDLFRYLSPKDMVWHYHGVLLPPAAAQKIVIVEDEAGRDVGCLLYDRADIGPEGGRMIVSTLDPFYHHGSHFMPATTRFLDGFLAWTDATFRRPYGAVSRARSMGSVNPEKSAARP
jgi:hypothetical protein